MLQALVEIQSKLIRGGAAQPLLDALLSLVLEFTQSECGFLCEVPPTQQAGPRFQPLASSPPTWMEQLRELALGKDGRAQEPLGSLVEAALTTGRPVSAGPLAAPAGGSQAPGAPRLGSLWILPVRSGDELVGLMGLANRRDGQDTDLMSPLQPALTACTSVLIGWRNEQQRRGQGEEQRHLRANLEQLKQALSSVEGLGALISAIPDLIFRMRSDGTFLDWNDGTREPTALPPEAFLGKKIQELPLPRTFAEKTVEHVRRVIRDGNLSVYEYELEMPKGLQRYEARIVRSGPDEAVSIIRNVTERTLVEERQAQLLRTEKLASLGQLAAGIAHEINNPVDRGGDLGHWQGDDRGDARADLHALLHHQAPRPGHKAGALHQPRHHHPEWRPHRRSERA